MGDPLGLWRRSPRVGKSLIFWGGLATCKPLRIEQRTAGRLTRRPMPTSSEEPLRPPLAASSPMKGSLWALLRLISRVYCGKAASESEQTGPYGAAMRPPSELRTSGTPASAVRSGNRPAPPDGRHLTGQKVFGCPLRGGHKAAKTNHESLATSHEH